LKNTVALGILLTLQLSGMLTLAFNIQLVVANPVHDVTLANVTPSKNIVGQGYNVSIYATVENQGDFTETFNVTVYANTTEIGKQVVTLPNGSNTTLSFAWKTFGFVKGNHTLSAYAEPALGETDTADNNCTDGTVLVTLIGDANGDEKVDGKDIALMARYFGKRVGQLGYTPNVDVTCDGKIDGKDIAIAARHYGRARIPKATIYFDRNVYYPSAKVFWEPEVVVPIGVTVIDDNIALDFVIVNISSSVDSKNVTLASVESGLFFGTLLAVGLRLGESISNSSNFNVRYGDVITAEYSDTHWQSTVQTNALFLFPKFVDDKLFGDPIDGWKLFDAEGIPLVDYTLWGQGIQYYPITIAQYALAQYHAYLDSGDITFRDKFLLQANWLARRAEQKGNFSVWESKFDWTIYACTNPWVSAMAQGHGLSVLSRAYVLTGNTTYLDVAETAIRSFEVEMNSSGVRYTDLDGVWYEEYADDGAPSSKVLNGFMFALFGLYEYSFLTNNSKGYALFWEGTHTLSVNLYRYDSGSWSYYDLYDYILVPLYYHKLHIEQLKTMYELTSLEIFLYYSDKFQSYIH